MVEHVGPLMEESWTGSDWWGNLLDQPGPTIGRLWQPSGVRRALNNRIRTGTDKGNLTV